MMASEEDKQNKNRIMVAELSPATDPSAPRGRAARAAAAKEPCPRQAGRLSLQAPLAAAARGWRRAERGAVLRGGPRAFEAAKLDPGVDN
jgi:hypothetical protein